ncbi:hypothetical protein J2S19_003670 [Metabacillus malikii]|uniref:DUF3889 domain-containing protein n=2 Tax=Metabacillus malikii TaxID=1504265 RepID=A0ABT9ZJ96_9BACI|nr:hypothetical protein [Metabacillus malikii]
MEEHMKAKTVYRIFFLLATFMMVLTAGMKAYGEQHVEEIDYKKWSRLAISTVKEEYPQSELIDYKYVKREAVNEEESKDVFRIKVNQHGELFYVSADVVFNPKTAKLITVNLKRDGDNAAQTSIILD